MVLALLIPLVHVTLVVSNIDNIEEPFQDIGRIRGYYTELISMTDSEFSESKYRKYKSAVFEGNNDFLYSDFNNKVEQLSTGTSIKNGIDAENRLKHKNFNPAVLILLIYFAGVLVFFIRLMVLLGFLFKAIKNNPRSKNKEYNLVHMNEEIPPFSFFRYIFVTKEATKFKDFEQILTHEKVHVKQKHSLDLLMAHVVTVFQWFNPLAWQMQKAIKTTHEYIADSKVVNQGFELFDYQSLLLSQLISIRSVELVNNFNLVSIKKRIEMMTKNKSRFSAKLKALLVIPMALLVFFLFADMTVKSPILSFTNFGSVKFSNLDGIWENKDNSFGKLLLFKGGELSVLESANEVNVIDLSINIKDDVLQINNFGQFKESLKYQLIANELKIWWSDNEFGTYTKTNYKNSFEAFKPKTVGNINLPVAEYAKILDKTNMLINVYVMPDKYMVDDVECNINDLKTVLSKRVSKFNKLDIRFVTTRLVVDVNTQMNVVYDLYQILRELRLLKIGYASLPVDNASILQYHASALPQLLPPTEKDGAELLERDDVKEKLIVIEPGGNLNKKGIEFEDFILNHPDYIAAFDWKNTTKYGDFVAIMDMTFKVIYKLRNAFTMEKYGIKYSDLPKALQKEARKKYPMRISQSNTDED